MKQKIENIKAVEEISFNMAFKGLFYGVLRWHQLDHIWSAVKSDPEPGWYIYEVEKSLPTSALKDKTLEAAIDKIDSQLRQDHDEDYCGIVYADNLENPEFIKVFDPQNLGTSCSISSRPPLPKWIISKLKPEELNIEKKETNLPKRWFGNLFSK